MVLAMMIVSGALAGLAGVTYYHRAIFGSIQPKVLASTGFDAIAVALPGKQQTRSASSFLPS